MAQAGSTQGNHSVQQWHASNEHQYQAAETELMRAERARDEHERLRRETDERRERTQADVSVKLSQRLNDVNFWHEEITRRQAEIQQRIQLAVDLLARLTAALKDTELPLETNSRCLGNRERRQGIELVHDCVQVELLKEKDVVKGAAGMLKRTIEQVKEQLRLLRKSAYNLNKDVSDKDMSLSIDGDCLRRNEGTIAPYTLPDQPKLDSKTVAPPDWEDFSDTNIVTGEQRCHAYDKLSGIAHDIMAQCCDDITFSRTEANRAFEKRIAETRKAKQELETRRQKVEEERESVGNDISELQTAIQAKIPALQLSEYRQAQRGERPNIELVRDPVYYRLLAEAAELDESIKRLQDAHATAVHHYEMLCSRHVALTEDIERKAVTLQIDQVECTGLRAQLPDLWTNQ